MTQDRLFGYLPSDFGQSLPPDPMAAAQTAASVAVTLSRAAVPVEMSVSGSVLAAPMRIGACVFDAGAVAEIVWSLVDSAKGIRMTAYRLSAIDGEGDSAIAIAAAMPLKPGQGYKLSMPLASMSGAEPFVGGFVAGTRILTEAGKRPIEDIAIGDRIWTEASGFQGVVWHGVQTVPARGMAAPLRLRRGLLGLTEDLLLAGSQCVRIDGPEGPLLVPASAFEAAGKAMREFGAAVQWHQLLLPGHAVIFAHGLPCESLWAPALLQVGRPMGWPAGQDLPDAPVLPRLSEEDGLRHVL